MINHQKQFAPVAVMTNWNRTPVSFSETLGDLRRRGYQLKFRREGTLLYCVELGRWFTPDSFTIDESYHFENGLKTSGEHMLYAISSTQGVKGFLIDTCFANPDDRGIETIDKPEWEYLLTETFYA